jgi:UDP-N-acetylmuramoyl-tripeptide--D-alanyl-D-alanine ligase
MRGDRSFTLIDDSYNANPASMRAAFSVLGAAEPAGRGRRVAVLGDMLELGRETGRMHAGLADDLAESGVRLVFLCGPEMARLEAAMKDRAEVTHAPDSETLAPKVAAAVGDGDVVLVKGSLGSRMAVVVEALKSLGEGGRAAAARG